MTETAHKLIMLKPMQLGVSGYARLQDERGRVLMQLNLRGLNGRGARVFWYCGGGEVKELGAAPVNLRGEACLTAEAPWQRVAPERLQAVLVVEDSPAPRPLMIGLCVAQSAGSLLDAKNASLSLCEKLSRQSEAASGGASTTGGRSEASGGTERNGLNPLAAINGGAQDMTDIHALGAALQGISPQGTLSQGTPPKGAPSSRNHSCLTGAPPEDDPRLSVSYDSLISKERREKELAGSQNAMFTPPREIFLPAIDPSPYIQAAGDGQSANRAADRKASSALDAAAPAQSAAFSAPEAGLPTQNASSAVPPTPEPPARRAADHLPKLCWPQPFGSLQGYFRRLPPCRVFDMPGWRFVCVTEQGEGLWLGYQQRDDRVSRVAYAMRGEPDPSDNRPYQRRRGLDGLDYRVLVQRAHGA